MKYPWAVPGAKVVCIKRTPWKDLEEGETGPSHGDVLTIRDVFATDDVYLRFNEIVNPLVEYDEGLDECTFWAGQFRPYVSLEQDVALFAHHLTKAPVPA